MAKKGSILIQFRYKITPPFISIVANKTCPITRGEWPQDRDFLCTLHVAAETGDGRANEIVK